MASKFKSDMKFHESFELKEELGKYVMILWIFKWERLVIKDDLAHILIFLLSRM